MLLTHRSPDEERGSPRTRRGSPLSVSPSLVLSVPASAPAGHEAAVAGGAGAGDDALLVRLQGLLELALPADEDEDEGVFGVAAERELT